MRLRHLELTPNFALRSAITDWAAANGVRLPERPPAEPAQPAFKWEEGRGNILPVRAGVVQRRRGACLPGPAGACAVPCRAPPCLPSHPPAHLQGHTEIIWAIETAGDRVYTASADKTVRVWDAHTKRCVQVSRGRPEAGHGRPGCLLPAARFRGAARLQHALCVLRASSPLLAPAPTFPQVLESHTRPVLSLAVCGNRLFSGSYDYSIRVWNLATLQREKTLTGHADAVRALAVAGNKVFSASYDGTVKVGLDGCWWWWQAWGARRAQLPSALMRCALVPAYCAASARSVLLLTILHRPAWCPLQVWDAETLTCLATLAGHQGPVRTLVRCGDKIFSGSYDKTVSWCFGAAWRSARPGMDGGLEGRERSA